MWIQTSDSTAAVPIIRHSLGLFGRWSVNRWVALVFGTAMVTCILGSPVVAASLRTYESALNANTCPKGTAYAALDGCQDASPVAMFKNSNMNELFRDARGNVASLAVTPGTDFNVAGRDFGVGPRLARGETYKDPFYQSFTCVGCTITNGDTLNLGTVTQGQPANGMTLFSPAGGNIPDQDVVLSQCNGKTCKISRRYSNRGGNPWHGSFVAPCKWQNNSPAVSAWTCDYRYPNHRRTSIFSKITFGAIGGHTGSTLRVIAADNGLFNLVIRDSHIPVDASTYRQSMINTVVGVKGNLVFEWNDCDGGNASVTAPDPAPGDFPFPSQTACLTWGARGDAGGIAEAATISFRFNYVHDYAGNPIQISAGYTNTLSQANVFDRVGMNNGDNPGGKMGTTGLHGATINWNTTAVGSKGWIRRYNDVAIYPYGFRRGVTTAPFAILGGVGSAVRVEYDQQLTTAIMNTSSSDSGKALSSQWINFLRVGAVDKFIAKKNFVSTIGIGHGGCFAMSGDIQGGIQGWMFSDAGSGRSTWTVSGLFGQAPLPLPGQAVSSSPPSGTTQFRATLTDLLNGTSRMDIRSAQIGTAAALPIGSQVVALWMANTKQHPTLIVRQINRNSYVVNNSSGSGETRAEQSFRVAQVIQDFGVNGATAAGGSTPASFNGSYSLGGERTVASTKAWYAVGVGLGNLDTLQTDVANNVDVLSGSPLTVDGVGLGQGSCPGTGSL